MNQTHIPYSQQTINKWSGGTTTELYIYPEGAQYKALDFDFRISTATVEVEESTFSSLKDINRKLMVLEGSTTLHHLNQHSKALNKFDVDTFSGNWQTKSVGKCRDFNLMTSDACQGEIEAISFKGESIINTLDLDFIILFAKHGKIAVSIDNYEIQLQHFDTFIIQNPDKNIILNSVENSELIITRINTK